MTPPTSTSSSPFLLKEPTTTLPRWNRAPSLTLEMNPVDKVPVLIRHLQECAVAKDPRIIHNDINPGERRTRGKSTKAYHQGVAAMMPMKTNDELMYHRDMIMEADGDTPQCTWQEALQVRRRRLARRPHRVDRRTILLLLSPAKVLDGRLHNLVPLLHRVIVGHRLAPSRPDLSHHLVSRTGIRPTPVNTTT